MALARLLPQVAQEVRITIVGQPLVIFCALLFIVILAGRRPAAFLLLFAVSFLIFPALGRDRSRGVARAMH